MKKRLSKKSKIISTVVVLVLILGSIAFWAAYRYLIPREKYDLADGNENLPSLDEKMINVALEQKLDEDIPAISRGDSKSVDEDGLVAEGAEVTKEDLEDKDAQKKQKDNLDLEAKASSKDSKQGVVVSSEGVEDDLEEGSDLESEDSSKNVKNDSNVSGEKIAETSKEDPRAPGEAASAKPEAKSTAECTAESTNESQTENDQAKDSQKTASEGNEISSSEEYTVTDTSYVSDNKIIKVKEVVTGEGKDTVTYYVADVKIANITHMKSAFAENKFGRNIIQGTSEIAKANDAILAINGDYYGFRKDGIEIRNGVLFRDEPARTGLAFYIDGSMKIYDEKQTNGKELLSNGVWNTVSFGPALLIDGEIGTGLETYQVDTNFGNHPIQGLQPRTGIGMIEPNHFVFVVVDGRNRGHSKGVKLKEFAQIFKDLGCKTAYNIDGGGSATMNFMGRRLNNPCGKNKERGTSDILYIK